MPAGCRASALVGDHTESYRRRMRGVLAGCALVVLVLPLTGCVGDYIASGECADLADELTPLIEHSLGERPALDSTWGDGSMMPWCLIDFTTADAYPADDGRLGALKSKVAAQVEGWRSGVIVKIHTGTDASLEVRSPTEYDRSVRGTRSSNKATTK